MMPDKTKEVLLKAVQRATDEHLQAMFDAAAAGNMTSGTYYKYNWLMRCPLCILATGIDNGEQDVALTEFYLSSDADRGWGSEHEYFYNWFDVESRHGMRPEAIAAVLEVVAAEQQRRKEQSLA
jgi:hypothetical protein